MSSWHRRVSLQNSAPAICQRCRRNATQLLLHYHYNSFPWTAWDQLGYHSPGATKPWLNKSIEPATIGRRIKNLLSAQNFPPATSHMHYCFLLDEIACMCLATVQPKNKVCPLWTLQRELAVRPNLQSTLLVRCLEIGETMDKENMDPVREHKKTQQPHKEDTPNAICVRKRDTTSRVRIRADLF